MSLAPFLIMMGCPSSRFHAMRGVGWPVALHQRVAFSPSDTDRSPLVSSLIMSGGTATNTTLTNTNLDNLETNVGISGCLTARSSKRESIQFWFFIAKTGTDLHILSKKIKTTLHPSVRRRDSQPDSDSKHAEKIQLRVNDMRWSGNGSDV